MFLDIPDIVFGDWWSVQAAVNQIRFRLGTDASPTYTGLTLSGLTASALVGADADKALESVTIGTGLDYTRPTLSFSHLGIESLTDPGVDKILFWDDSETACGWLGVGNSIAITTTTLDTIQDIRTTASPTWDGATFTNTVLIDQDNDAIGLNIDSEATTLTNYGLQCVTGQGATAAYFAYGNGNNGCMYVGLPPNSGYQGVVSICRNLTAGSTDNPVLCLYQQHTADDQPCLEVIQNGVGKGLSLSTSSLDTTNAAQYGIYLDINPSKTAAAMTNRSTGIYCKVDLGSGNTQNWSQALAGLIGFHTHIETDGSSSGTVTGSIGLLATSTFADAATVITYAGVFIETPSVTNNKLTNAYGLYVDNINTAQTNNYAIYTLAGLVRLGGATTCYDTFESIGVATLADESVTKTTAAPTTDAMIANKKYVDDVHAGAPAAHNHDGDTLQHDGVNSNGGAFSFTTSGMVTFNQDVSTDGHFRFNIDRGSIGLIDNSVLLAFDATGDWVEVTGRLVPDGDNTRDLGAVGASDYRWKDLYLAGNLSDETNSLTVANAKTAYDHSQIAGGDSVHVSTTENTNWDAAYTHVSNNGTDHSYIDQDLQTSASPTFAGLSLGIGELTCGSINRTTGTLTLEIGGTAEISITSTTVTLGGNLIIPDSGTIGSASDTDVMTIDASGNTTFSVFPITPSAAPDADYEVANKKYVDDNIGGGGGILVQEVYAETGAVNTGSTLLPFDDTIPQQSEGNEVITVSITPTSATNKLVIEGIVNFSNSVTTSHTLALFQDATDDALAVSQIYANANEVTAIPIRYEMVAGTTDSTTFKLRCGGHAAGTVTINGYGSNRKFGGVMLSTIRVQEVSV